jgi:hypothetical protein
MNELDDDAPVDSTSCQEPPDADNLTESDTESGEQEYEYEPEIVVMPSASGASARQQALEGLSADERDAVMTEAGRWGVRDSEDIMWMFLRGILNMQNCNLSSAQALTMMAESLARFNKTVFDVAVVAGKDIAGQVKHEVMQVTADSGRVLKYVIDTSANAGAELLKQASADIDLKIQGVGKSIDERLAAESERAVEEYNAALKKAVEKQAKMGVMNAAARNMVVALLVLGLSFGAGFVVNDMLTTHLPPHLHIEHVAGRSAYVLVAPALGYFTGSKLCSQGFCIDYSSSPSGHSSVSGPSGHSSWSKFFSSKWFK